MEDARHKGVACAPALRHDKIFLSMFAFYILLQRFTAKNNFTVD